jgi:hypothetical protein
MRLRYAADLQWPERIWAGDPSQAVLGPVQARLLEAGVG